MTTSNKTAIVVAIITVIGTIAVALITAYPWNKQEHLKSSKISVTYNLSGTVIDEQLNQNIPQAEVDVVGRNEQYYTEENGNFKIVIKDSIKSIRIRVLKRGFKPYDKSFDLPDNNVIIQLIKIKHD